MVHLSVNFPTNLAGESAIRWAGINPDADNDQALIRKRDEPEEEIDTMLDHAPFKIHSITRLYKLSMYPNDNDDKFVFHARPLPNVLYKRQPRSRRGKKYIPENSSIKVG